MSGVDIVCSSSFIFSSLLSSTTDETAQGALLYTCIYVDLSMIFCLMSSLASNEWASVNCFASI